MKHTHAPMRRRAALALSGLLLASAVAAAPALADTKLLETGSSLVYPLMNDWVKAYQAKDSSVQITTQSTGSGAGISQAIAGVAQIGASDAYVSDGQMKTANVLNIPLAISAQQINYNIPELGDAHLNLSGPVLAGIYDGSIRKWDDQKIKDINKSLASKLPSKDIVPVRRSDGSGDTFIFSQYLSDTTPSWKNGPAYGTTISWPAVPNEVGAKGNTGMIDAAKGTPYSIAYIGISYINETKAAKLGYAALQGMSGSFVLPTPETIKNAVNSLASKTPTDERVSLINAPGKDAYPIINYEYAIINPKQPNAESATALKKFLNWAVSSDGGSQSQYLDKVHFVALPESVVAKSRAQIDKIS